MAVLQLFYHWFIEASLVLFINREISRLSEISVISYLELKLPGLTFFPHMAAYTYSLTICSIF